MRMCRWREASFIGIGLISPRTLVAQQVMDCNSNPSWDVASAEPYTWEFPYPQGCSCQEAGVSAKECKYFNCGCVCDLTAGACDANCCCDPECSAEAVERFEKLGNCLPDGSIPDEKTKCFSKSSLSSINPKFPLKPVDTAMAALDGLLCVEFDNSAYQGGFTEDPSPLTGAAFTSSSVYAPFTYADGLSGGLSSGPTEGDIFYDKGDRMPAGFTDEGGSNGLVAAFGGYVPLPSPGVGGLCSETSYMHFNEPVVNRTCVRILRDPEAECSRVFGYTRLTSSLYVAATGGSVPVESPTDGSFLGVEISKVTHYNWNTGEQSSFSDVNCDIFWYKNGDVPGSEISSCILGNREGNTLNGLVASDPDSVNTACYNALLSVCYTITHNDEGRASNITAEVILTDIPKSAEDDSTNPLLAVEQSYTAQFLSSATPQIMPEAGNQVTRIRSGSPGYRNDAPVLLGRRSSTSTSVMDVPQRGLQVAGGGGSCVEMKSEVVGFGYDMMTCCGLEMTRDELKEMCEGSGTFLSPDGFTPAALRGTDFIPGETFIGAFGNADPVDVGQWIAVDIDTGTATQSWDEQTGVCNHVVSSLNWRLLYARIGAHGNRQAKIVAASSNYGKDRWVWLDDGDTSTTRTQMFQVCSTVTFIEYGAKDAIFQPPPPPLAFKVPWDIFYPFSLNNGVHSVKAGCGWAIVCSVFLSFWFTTMTFFL